MKALTEWHYSGLSLIFDLAVGSFHMPDMKDWHSVGGEVRPLAEKDVLREGEEELILTPQEIVLSV